MSIAAMAFIAITAASGVLVAAAIFGLASVPFLVTAIYELSGSDGWKTAAGVVGVVLVALALYGAWAAQLEAAAGRTVLPLGRRGKGKEAVYGSLLEQVKDIAHQPGVRERL